MVNIRRDVKKLISCSHVLIFKIVEMIVCLPALFMCTIILFVTNSRWHLQDSNDEFRDAESAWLCVKHAKSNAIVTSKACNILLLGWFNWLPK